MCKIGKEVKKLVEEDLENYPLWLINTELPGLGSATDWTKVYKKISSSGSYIEGLIIKDEVMKRKVEIITGVLMFLNPLRKKIIEEWYFRDMKCREEILQELAISKSVFYREKNAALNKFIVALGYKNSI
ncbi:nitroreductase [Clostridium perfringens]|uniref:nitroreductase n=1 Tax=Clostridium perfringens TaxID=1502 RepID=UPI001C8589A6|nr:nitroreductase [Clostridium perfringens]MDK0590726.1 nitroreductase [Clostridium perfringens]MDK0666917.1 nitroreductase [Clostridium perfringens]MDZ5048607.1 nitroreductase [Clostridium perfringens]